MQNRNPNQRPNRNNPLRNPLTSLIVFFVLVGLFQLVTNGITGMGQVEKISSSEFIQELDEGKIEEFDLRIGAGVYEVEGSYKEDTSVTEESDDFIQIIRDSKPTENFSTRILGNDSTLKEITDLALAHDTKMTTIPESSVGLWVSMLPMIVITFMAIAVMYTMFQQNSGGGRGGMMNFGKSKAKDISQEEVKVRFKDVAGLEEEKQELVEVVEFLKDPKKFTKLGARIPAGVLLEGPPGTGKTLLAKAVAGEAKVPFFSISGSEFVEMFVGVGASRVRDLFENAKKNAPSIIFIDEIDAVGRQRGAGMGGGHDEREQTLNQMLVEMDGFEGNEGVIVIAATNRSDVLDPALLRPGRFDRQILVGNPDVKGREAILRVHARNKRLAPEVDLKVLAQQTPGFSGADLENLLNEAALVAARFDRKEIIAEDVDEAHDRVIAGVAKADSAISPEQRRIIAYHEAGHTVVGMVLSDARTVHKVTIVPRGRAGGYAIMLPKEDRFIVTKEELYQQVVGLLGGRVAEEIVFDTQSTGASNDFQQATQIVRKMITEYGMSEKLGTVQYEGQDQVFVGRTYGQSPAYSEQVAYEIDNETRRMMQEAHDEAHRIIEEHREQLNLIAEKLLEVETLDAREIKSLFETGHMPGPLKEAEISEEEPEQAQDFQESKEASDQNLAEREAKDRKSRVQKALDEDKDVLSQDHDSQDE